MVISLLQKNSDFQCDIFVQSSSYSFNFINLSFIVDRWKHGEENFNELRNKGMKKVLKSSNRNWVAVAVVIT